MRVWLMLGLMACGTQPRASSEIPPNVKVPVTIDGLDTAVIDSPRLARTSHDERGWRLVDLVGAEVAREDGVVELTGSSGTRTRHLGPARGDLRVSVRPDGTLHLVPRDAADPRDPSARLGAITAIDVHLLADEDHTEPAMATLAAPLRVRDADGSVRALTIEELDDVASLEVEGAGKSARPGWRIEAIVPGAARVELTGEAGPLVVDLSDPARRPALRLNRQGKLKLVWLDANGMQVGGPQLRGVTEIAVRSAP